MEGVLLLPLPVWETDCESNDVQEREKEAHKAFTAASWGTLVQCLAQLATAERMYLSLTFLEQKRFHSIGRSKEVSNTLVVSSYHMCVIVLFC